MLIPIQHLLDVISDVVTPEFCPSGEACGEPTITTVPVPRRVSQGATWVAVLGGGGPPANDCPDDIADDIRRYREHLRSAGSANRARNRARVRMARTAISSIRDRPRFEAGDFEDFEDDVIQVGDDGFELETVQPKPLAVTGPGMSIAEIATFAVATGGSFAFTHTASTLVRTYFAKRWPDLPAATGPIGVAGLVTVAALALKFHRVPIAIGAAFAALVVASSRRKKPKAKGKRNPAKRSRRKAKTKPRRRKTSR